MDYRECKQDLFELDSSYTLVHCISLDAKMGAGIAKAFDNKFKEMKKDLQDTISINDLSYPISIMYTGEQQLVINMITKEKYWNKPTYRNFEYALNEVASICIKHDIKKLAMPKIGCGLDKLEWNKVKELIEDYFDELDIEIIVCSL